MQLNDIVTLTSNVQNGRLLSSYSFSWAIDTCLSAGCIYGSSYNDFVRVAVGRVDLSSGYKFKATLTVTDKTTGVSAQGSVWVEVDQLPVAGQISIYPTDGYAWSTNYTVTASGFSVASGKLYYRFYYMKTGSTELIPVSLRTEASSLTTQFPAGSTWYDYAMTVFVRAYNERGGHIDISTTFTSKTPSSATAYSTVVSQYETLKGSVDQNDPASLLKQALLGTLLLSKINETSGSQTGSQACNGQGVMNNGNCICNLDYAKRTDCSISDAEFALETQLAAKLLGDTASLVQTEPSSAKYETAFQIVLNVADKEDMLDQSARAVARNLLLICTNTTTVPDSYTDLAKAIDGVAVMSNTNAAEKEFAQMKTLIDRLVVKQLEKVNLTSGSDVIDSRMDNVRIRSVLTRGSLNATINMGNIVFPTTLVMLNNTDTYVRLSVAEWDTPVYSWISDYAKARSNVISIEVRTIDGATKNITSLSAPVNIAFPLSTGSISAQDLTALRCMYYNNYSGQYLLAGMKFVSIDLENEVGNCQAFHFTDFVMAVPTGGMYILPDSDDDTTLFGAKVKVYKLYLSPLFWFTVSVTIICGYLCLWAYCKEKSENELVDLMRNKAYLEQKDFFQEKTKVELAPASLNDSGGRQHDNGGNSSGGSGSGSDPHRISSMAEGSSQVHDSVQDSTPASALGSARGAEATRVEPFNNTSSEDKKEDTFRKASGEPQTVIGVPEETANPTAKKDDFDRVATPVPGTESADQAAKPRRFRRKRKFKKGKKGNRAKKDPEAKAEAPTPVSAFDETVGVGLVSTPAPAALDLVIAKTGAENIEEVGASKKQGTISMLLVSDSY